MTKAKFNKYVQVQKSGVINMWAVNTVMELTGLTKDECMDIMKNYLQYQKQFTGK